MSHAKYLIVCNKTLSLAIPRGKNRAADWPLFVPSIILHGNTEISPPIYISLFSTQYHYTIISTQMVDGAYGMHYKSWFVRCTVYTVSVGIVWSIVSQAI